jgi:hypothetical protein
MIKPFLRLRGFTFERAESDVGAGQAAAGAKDCRFATFPGTASHNQVHHSAAVQEMIRASGEPPHMFMRRFYLSCPFDHGR